MATTALSLLRGLRALLPSVLIALGFTSLPQSACSETVASGSSDNRVVFVSWRSDRPQLYAMTPEGREVTLLTEDLQFDSDPAVSPDGSRIAFVRSFPNGSGWRRNAEIFVMETASGKVQQFSMGFAPGIHYPAPNWSPAWSPDGRKIAHTWTWEDKEEILTIDLASGVRKMLTSNSASDHHPAWSPDGSKIAFASDRDGRHDEIYLMNADGSNPVRLTRSERASHSPAWSPDGRMIAFVSDRDGNDEIYLMQANGGDQINLTRSAGDDSDPAFIATRSGGLRLLFTSNRGGNKDIYSIEPDGTDLHRLTHHQTDDLAPSSGLVLTRPEPSSEAAEITFTPHRYDKRGTVSLGFDDGVSRGDLIVEMLLKRFDLHGTLFIIGQTIAGKGKGGPASGYAAATGMAEIARGIGNGGTLEMGAHSRSHTYPLLIPSLTRRDWERDELAWNNALLEELFGRKTVGFAYPWGVKAAIRFRDVVLNHYLYGRTTQTGDSRYTELGIKDLSTIGVTENRMQPEVCLSVARKGGWYRNYTHSAELKWEQFSGFLKAIEGRPELHYTGYDAAVEYQVLRRASRSDGVRCNDDAGLLSFRVFTELANQNMADFLSTPITVKVNLNRSRCKLKVDDLTAVFVEGVRTKVLLGEPADGTFLFEVPQGEHQVVIRKGATPLPLKLEKPVISGLRIEQGAVNWSTDVAGNGVVYYTEIPNAPLWQWKLLGRENGLRMKHSIPIPQKSRIARFAAASTSARGRTGWVEANYSDVSGSR